MCWQEIGPDCPPKDVIENGDSRKWDIIRVMEWDITVNQPDGYSVGSVVKAGSHADCSLHL